MSRQAELRERVVAAFTLPEQILSIATLIDGLVTRDGILTRTQTLALLGELHAEGTLDVLEAQGRPRDSLRGRDGRFFDRVRLGARAV